MAVGCLSRKLKFGADLTYVLSVQPRVRRFKLFSRVGEELLEDTVLI
jgi:hypothetical protein